LRLTTSNSFFQLNTCGHSPYVTSPLTRGWVCRLELLLALASAVILRPESRGIYDHILVSQILDSPNLEGRLSVSISPRNKVSVQRHCTYFLIRDGHWLRYLVNKISPSGDAACDSRARTVGFLTIALAQFYLRIWSPFIIYIWSQSLEPFSIKSSFCVLESFWKPPVFGTRMLNS
jgi:hypothetical protein